MKFTSAKGKFVKNTAIIIIVISLVIGSTLTVTSHKNNYNDGGMGTPLGGEFNITVKTDQLYYYQGEQVNISGQLTESGVGVPGGVCIDIYDPLGILIHGVCTATNMTGHYFLIYNLAPDAMFGIYNVSAKKADDYNVSAYVFFEVVSSIIEPDAHGPYETMLGDPIQFQGDVVGGKLPYTWYWDFGDDNISYEQNPIHTYGATGEYTVYLEVVDNGSNSGDDVTSAYVYGEDFGYFLMVSTDEPEYYNGDTVEIFGRLTNNGTGIPSIEITIEIMDPQGSSEFYQATTNITGYYTLNYQLDYGAILGTYYVNASVFINGKFLYADTYFEVHQLMLDVDANGLYYGKVGQELQFFGNASGGVPPYTWHWDFGDGANSSDQNPIHIYNASGEYEVRLDVLDSYNNPGLDITTANITEQSEFTHTVLTEYATMTTCEPCVTASEQLYEIYNSHNYDFYYVTLVSDQNDKAQERHFELGSEPYPVPDVYFDGGFENILGAQQSTQPYENAIETCGERIVADVDLAINISWNNDDLEIEIIIVNNELENYEGTLRIYVVEPISRWNNNHGEPYHFGLLDLVIESVSVADETIITKTWNGAENGFEDVSENNIMVIAAVFDEGTQYVDDVSSDVPENSLAIKITKPQNALYIGNNKIRSFYYRKPLIIGKIDIEIDAIDVGSEINYVEFLIDDELKENDTEAPYSWTWDELAFFKHSIKAITYNVDGNSVSDEIIVWKFF